MNTTISFAVVCAVVALAAQIYAMFNGHKKNVEDRKNEKIELEKSLLRFDLKLDEVNKSVSSLVETDKNKTTELKNINASIIKFEESLKGAWKKIDSHEERLLDIEKEVIKHE